MTAYLERLNSDMQLHKKWVVPLAYVIPNEYGPLYNLLYRAVRKPSVSAIG